MSQPVLALVGPTASGKTAASISLARALAGSVAVEIVSLDSALVYRGLDIGSGKPTLEERGGIPHHLLDVREPERPYSAAEFARDARAVVSTIRARGACALLVGGTGLYLRAFRDGLSPLPGADPSLRSAMEDEARRRGWGALHRRLARLDPEAAARILPTDPQRIQRALEVHALTGQPISALQRVRSEEAAPWPVAVAGLVPGNRAWLHERIAGRFAAMLSAGLEEEVAALDARGLSPQLPALRAVGYRQVLAYLHGEVDRDTMIRKAVVATRQLARRQLTWLRRERPGRIVDPSLGDPGRALLDWASDQLGLAGRSAHMSSDIEKYRASD